MQISSSTEQTQSVISDFGSIPYFHTTNSIPYTTVPIAYHTTNAQFCVQNAVAAGYILQNDSLQQRENGPLSSSLGFPHSSVGKESSCNAGDLGSIPGLGRSPGEGKDYPLQYSGLENCIKCIVHGVSKSRTRLSDFHFHFASSATMEICTICKNNWKLFIMHLYKIFKYLKSGDYMFNRFLKKKRFEYNALPIQLLKQKYNKWCINTKVDLWLFNPQLMCDSFVTARPVALQAPLSMGFPRQEYQSGLPFPSSWRKEDPGIKLASPALSDRFSTPEPPGKAKVLLLTTNDSLKERNLFTRKH